MVPQRTPARPQKVHKASEIVAAWNCHLGNDHAAGQLAVRSHLLPERFKLLQVGHIMVRQPSATAATQMMTPCTGRLSQSMRAACGEGIDAPESCACSGLHATITIVQRGIRLQSIIHQPQDVILACIFKHRARPYRTTARKTPRARAFGH